MGTSASFRAPPVPRWHAFTMALQMQLPLERVRSELFNAGQQWEDALAAPAVAEFAAALVRAVDVLPDRLAAEQRPEPVLQAYLAETRLISTEHEPTPARAVAERALSALLTRCASGDSSLADQTAEQAAQHLRESLGARERAVSSYLGEVLAQYARHVAAREVGRLTEGPEGMTVRAARRTTRELAQAAEELGRSVQAARADPASVRAGWDDLVREAFRRGRELPRAAR